MGIGRLLKRGARAAVKEAKKHPEVVADVASAVLPGAARPLVREAEKVAVKSRDKKRARRAAERSGS